MFDNTIKTLRNIVHEDIKRMMNNNEMQKAIQYLNNSISKSAMKTPTEMETGPQLEDAWIRRATGNNTIIKQLQEDKR
jgi:Txe/YoeB family toxin of Txe-Axe toxin-antitoxin module